MAAAIAPTLCATRVSAAAPDRLIAPPTGPMRYTRSVTRDLIDGEMVRATRIFDVTFRRFAGGFMMHGQQVEAKLEAPASLAAFVQLEEARDESDLFPIALDPFGQILSSRIAQPAGQNVRMAVDAAVEQIASQPISADEREQLSRFVSAMQLASQRVIAHLPTDLFAPAETSRRDERRVALPGGVEGKVATVYECERDSGTGLMRAASRDVVTIVADSSRGTRESWSLATL
jgi:hypothetical protein